MNFIRKLLGFFTAVAFLAMAAPATAQNVKYFTLGAPASVAPATTTVQITFKNVENGNSSFNSIGFRGIATGGATLTINSATATPGGPGSPLVTGDGYYYLTGLSPVKKGQTLTVTLSVTMSATGCANGQIEWQGRAFTGSPSQPSTAFQQQNANPVTVVSAGCNYTITGTTPSTMPRGTTKPLIARVTNAAGSSATISSVTLTPPVGGAITTPTTSYAGPIAPGTYADLAITATASCDTAKSAGAWTSAAAEAGFTHTGEPSTSLTGACALVATAPTSIVPGEPFTVSLKATDGEGGTIGGFTGTVTLVSTGAGCTIVGTPSVSAVAGLASITVSLNVDATTTTCTLKGTATIDGKTFDTAPISLVVFDGILGCSPTTFDAFSLLTQVPTGSGSFNESVPVTTPLGDAAYVAGVRGYGDDKSGGCTLINYAVYNNIPAYLPSPPNPPNTPNTSTQTDPLNNQVPPGFYSITWDTNQAPNPVVAVASTFRSEWGDAVTGLPTRQTKVCTVFPCPGDPTAFPAAWKLAPACLGSLVVHASVPAGESACLVAETWAVVAVGDPEYCTGTPPAAPPSPPPGWQPRCLQATTITIIGKDPVFGR